MKVPSAIPIKRHSVVIRLLVLVAAAAAFPALVISIAQQSISSNALKASIEREQTQLARRVAEEVNGQIHHAQELVSLLAHSSFFSAGSRVDQYEALRNLLNEVPSFQEAMFVTQTGEELVKVSSRGIRPALVRRDVDLKHSYIGAPFFSGNRLPTILIAEPIRSFANPTRSGAVLAKLSFTSLNQLMRDSLVGAHGTAYIVNEKGMLLAHPDVQAVLKHTNLEKLPVVQAWQKSPETPTALQEFADEKGEEVIALAYPIPLLKSAVVVEQPRADVYAPLMKMRDQFILWTLISLALFLALAIAVSWRILQPLRQLRSAAEQVGRGQMDVKLDIRTQDELEDLGRSFEAMAGSLAALERMRRDLITMIVHDLKMPLSTILPSLESLLAGDMGKLLPAQAQFIQMARRSGHDMLTLIQNLLDIAKMEEGKVTLLKERFAPSDWARTVIANFMPLAEVGKKRLTLTLGEDLPAADGDVPLLTRVLGNLLTNALRHTPSGTGEVEVAVYRDDHYLAVQVRDNGEGIPEEDQKRIFEKFVQGSGQKVTVRSGTGLGLTFCKMVVEAHGGRISLFSSKEEGSIFTFHLPLPVDAETPAEPTPSEPVALS